MCIRDRPDVVWFIRLPRLMLAVAVGMALSVSGTVMQAIVKNPLADPYILGVSSGASLGATLAIMLGIGTALGSNFIGIMGCLGALGVSFMVMMLSNIGGRSNSVKLLLSGMALSAVCSAFSSFIVYFANNKEGMMSITYWPVSYTHLDVYKRQLIDHCLKFNINMRCI